LEELLVPDEEQLFFDDQALYLAMGALVLETGRISRDFERLPLEDKMRRRLTKERAAGVCDGADSLPGLLP
jgi:hypothetical protein